MLPSEHEIVRKHLAIFTPKKRIDDQLKQSIHHDYPTIP